MKRPAIFLDRDGTLNKEVGYAHRVEDLALIEGVTSALRKLQALGFALVITTNQSGIARGYFSEDQMHAFNRALCEQLAASGVSIAGVYYCPFHPEAADVRYRRESELRKPQPGMILRAAAELGLEVAASYAIGDKRSDVLAGRAAGCRTVLVMTGDAGRSEPRLEAAPDFVAADLAAAAGWIERNHSTGIPASPHCAYPAARSANR